MGDRPSIRLGYALSREEHADAGFDQVHVHQVGPEQAGFMDF